MYGVEKEYCSIQGLEQLLIKEFNATVLEFIHDKMNFEEDFRLSKIAVVGSRVHGKIREDSDLDIAFEYTGDYRSYSICDTLNEEPLIIEGIRIDFIPFGLNKGEKMNENFPMIYFPEVGNVLPELEVKEVVNGDIKIKCPICDTEIIKYSISTLEHVEQNAMCRDKHHIYSYEYVDGNLIEQIGGVIFHNLNADSEEDRNLYELVIKLNREGYQKEVKLCTN